MLVSDWAEEVGINLPTIVTRLNRGGWTVERALTTMPRKQDPTTTGAEKQRRYRERKAARGE